IAACKPAGQRISVSSRAAAAQPSPELCQETLSTAPPAGPGLPKQSSPTSPLLLAPIRFSRDQNRTRLQIPPFLSTRHHFRKSIRDTGSGIAWHSPALPSRPPPRDAGKRYKTRAAPRRLLAPQRPARLPHPP